MNSRDSLSEMVFDSLTHVTPDGRWFSTHYDASERRLLKEMDEHGISKAVVVALAEYIDNDFVLGLCERYADRLVPGASFNPARFSTPNEVKRAARASLENRPFAVLKLHPRLNRYDPLGPCCLALLEEVASWDRPLPIWLCTFLHYQGANLRKPLVDTLHDLAGRFPSLKFVFLHAGGANILPLAQAIRDCGNVFLDLSFTLHRYMGSSLELDIKHLLKSFEKRLIFGSDFPEVSLGEAMDDFKALSMDLDKSSRSLVLGGNLTKLLGLG